MDHIGSGNGLVSEGTKPLPEPMLSCRQYDPKELISLHFLRKYSLCWSLKQIWKLYFQKDNLNIYGPMS